MKKTIDMLIAVKKPWLDRVTEVLASRDPKTWRPPSKDLARFWDRTADAFLRRDFHSVTSELETWLRTYFVAEIDTGKLTTDIKPILVPLLSSFESACLAAAEQYFIQEEQLHFCSEVIPLFNHLYEIASTLELGMYVHELRRREEAVRNEVQRLDETRSSFINTAAHELKTPLTLIEGYTEMLGETMKEVDGIPDHDVLMRGIRTGTNKMREIIDELIDVSLVDNQMLSLYYKPIQIGEILTSVAEDLGDAIGEKSLEFTIKSFTGSKEMTYADEERLAQAFSHVLRNAIQFTPEGGSVIIDGRMLPGFIEVSCEDSGIGIARTDQATIFEKFGHIPSSVARHDVGDQTRNTGAGLGLHLTKGILEAHGGTIWVESPGRDTEACPGSTFHLMVPIRSEAPEISKFEQFGLQHQERAE